jgi:hypothetical protein
MDAHDQAVTNNYIVHYPPHEARESDPHYRDFNAYRNATKDTAQCSIGSHRSDLSDCAGGLELHHAHIEFSLQNGVDLKWLEVDYPGVSNADEVGKWVESGANLLWLCEKHHRGVGGIHHASASDFEAEKYVRNLIGKREKDGKVQPQDNK